VQGTSIWMVFIVLFYNRSSLKLGHTITHFVSKKFLRWLRRTIRISTGISLIGTNTHNWTLFLDCRKAIWPAILERLRFPNFHQKNKGLPSVGRASNFTNSIILSGLVKRALLRWTNLVRFSEIKFSEKWSP